jgi:hypothetical protein
VPRFAGAVLPVRDVVDDRIVQEVRTGTGLIINTPAEVSGWPKYDSDTPPSDSDHDGMSDDWEKRYGLEPQDAADGYTNVEEYLNGTDPAGSDYGEYRMLRGGSFYYKSRQIFIYPHSEHRPNYRDFDVGFRVIRLSP